MAIDYTGHSRFSVVETRRRLAYARGAHPEWFDRILLVCDPPDRPGPAFVLDLSREFGIAAQCQFLMSVNDKEQLAAVDDAIEFVYSLFGTQNLVITWGLDTIRPPLGDYPGMPI